MVYDFTVLLLFDGIVFHGDNDFGLERAAVVCVDLKYGLSFDSLSSDVLLELLISFTLKPLAIILQALLN